MIKNVSFWISLFFLCLNSSYCQTSNGDRLSQERLLLRLIDKEIPYSEKISTLQILLKSENSLCCQLALFCIGKEKIFEKCLIDTIFANWEKYGYFEMCTGIWVLGELGKTDTSTIKYLIGILFAKDLMLKRNATSSLNKLGINQKEDLLKFINYLDSKSEKQNLEQLLNIFEFTQKLNTQSKCLYLDFDLLKLKKFWPLILKFLKNYSATEELIPILINSLYETPISFYNIYALEMLEEIENIKYSEDLAECLIDQLGRESKQARKKALNLLKKMNYDVDSIILELKKKLDENQLWVTESTLWIIEILGFEQPESIEILLVGLQDFQSTGYLANELLKHLITTEENISIILKNFNKTNFLGRIRFIKEF